MNTFQLQSQLAYAVRSAASLRKELSAKQCSLIGRLTGRIRHAYLLSNIAALSRQLHMHRR